MNEKAEKTPELCHFCGKPSFPWEGRTHRACLIEENARQALADMVTIDQSPDEGDAHVCTETIPVHLRDVA